MKGFTSIIKKASDYKLEDLHNYCERNGYEFDRFHPYFHTWCIHNKEELLEVLISMLGPNCAVKVTGTVHVPAGVFAIKKRYLTVQGAFDKILTPDLYDWEVFEDEEMYSYLIKCYHDESMVNLFYICKA